MTKILFTKSHILCHDVNVLTKSFNHVDVIMGSSSADIIWYEPISQKYARINKHVSLAWNQSSMSIIDRNLGRHKPVSSLRYSMAPWF